MSFIYIMTFSIVKRVNLFLIFYKKGPNLILYFLAFLFVAQLVAYSIFFGNIDKICLFEGGFTFWIRNKKTNVYYEDIVSFEDKPNFSSLILNMKSGEKIKLPIDTRKPFLVKKFIIKKINEQNS